MKIVRKDKHMAKKQKKVKKHRGLKIIFILFLLMVFIGCGYFGYLGYQELSQVKEEIIEFSLNMESSLQEDSIQEHITLPTQINEEIQLSWKSSQEDVITPQGMVHHPSFDEEDVKVRLSFQVTFQFKHIYTQMLSSFLIHEEDYPHEFEVTIVALLPTEEDIVKKVSEELILPTSTFDSILLPRNCYIEGVSIDWESDSPYINDLGNVTHPIEDTKANLTAHITYMNKTIDKSFTILILREEFKELEIQDTFDELATTSFYKDVKTSITYHEAQIQTKKEGVSEENDETETNPLSENYIRLRTVNRDGKVSGFDVPLVMQPLQFSFQYRFHGNQKTEGSTLKITYKTIIGGVETVILDEIVVPHLEEYTTYQKDLSLYDAVSIQVVYESTWTTETYLDLDQVLLTRKISKDEMIESLKNNIPTTLSKSYFLPTTTPYGGKVTWSSDHEQVLSSLGYVHRQSETTLVILTGTFVYLNETSLFTIEIKVKGTSILPTLEINFIDIGKYGASDCGEAIYIQYGTTDILVDAGDHFDTTEQAVEEAVNQHLQDGILDYVIATHPDSDHIGGMAHVFETFNVANLIKFEGENYTTKKFLNMKEAYEKEGCNVYEIYRDLIEPKKNIITIASDVYLEFLDTTYLEESTKESNGKSIVFVLNAFGTRILMTGDADNGSGHSDLEEKYMNQVGNIDILKVVHHGTAQGCSESFLKAIDPEVAIVCNGNYLGNKHGHPHADSINHLYQYDHSLSIYAICGGGTLDGIFDNKTRAYRCSSEERFIERNGTITIRIDANGYNISSEYYGSSPLEFSSTTYWNNNPFREYLHQN